MHVKYFDTQFNLHDTVTQELPMVAGFHSEGGLYNQKVQDLLEFPINFGDRMPFYTIREESCVPVGNVFEEVYAAMLAAVQFAFRDRQILNHFYDCDFIRKHGDKFVPYAKHTFTARQPTMYGRFDAAFDPVTEQVTGIYEFNGDTPVMLFESVNLQARYSETLCTDQYNNWWHESLEAFSAGYKKLGIVCDLSYVDDLATCDTIRQMLEASRRGRDVSTLDLTELEFAFDNPSKPFAAVGSQSYFDGLYILLPWEEMVESFPQMLDNWERWSDNVHLFEPAWRWFMSHKGCLALVTWMMENVPGYKQQYGHLPFLKTYLWKPERGSWVQKPVIGRLSSNIRIHKEDGSVTDTGGMYGDTECVFQEYHQPYKVAGRNNFILCMWMCNAPSKAGWNRGGSAATLCVREFDEEVLSLINERFIPHMVI